MKVSAKTALLAVLAVTLVAAVPAAARSAPDAGPNGAGIRGYVTDKAGGTILVEQKPCKKDGRMVKYTRCGPEKWRGDKGYFTVTKKTTIRDSSGQSPGPARLGDIRRGQTVRAAYGGEFQTAIYPSRGKAERIAILSRAGEQ